MVNLYTTSRIFSDYFASHQERNFNSKGYILHRVNHNHSVWFGQGSFHINLIE